MFVDKMMKEGKMKIDGDTNLMLNEMAKGFTTVAKVVLEESRGSGPHHLGKLWWWNEEVQRALKFKRNLIEIYIDVEIRRVVKNTT